MKKLILGATLGAALTATALTPALAWGPTRSDPHPPGALFQSTPSGAAKDDARGRMVSPPDDLRKRSAMRSSNVRMNARPLHHGTMHHHRGS